MMNYDAKYILFGKYYNSFSHIAVVSNGIIIDPVNPIFNNINPVYKYHKVIR